MEFDFSAGRLCLDFANTLHDRNRAESREDLSGYGDLVAFGVQGGVLSGRAARTLLSSARRDPERAAAAFRRSITLREAIYRAFSSIASGAQPGAADLAAIARAAADAYARSRLVPQDGAYVWRIEEPEADLDGVAWTAAQSAAELLGERERPPVRECSSNRCTWLFLDHSKNHSRRWCSMRDCGNRAKVRRYYERVRAARRGKESSD